MEWFLALTWQAWNIRNQWVMSGKCQDALRSVEWVASLVSDFQAVRVKPCSVKRPCPRDTTWSPPPLGTVAVTVDAAIDSNVRRTGAGCILRNPEGQLLASAISAINQQIGVPEAEAKAILFGMTTAAALNYKEIYVQSDSQKIIKMLAQTHSPTTELGMLVEEIKCLSNSFVSCDFSFIPRSCNIPAHKLAKYSLKFNSSVVWLDEAPPWLYVDIKADLPSN